MTPTRMLAAALAAAALALPAAAASAAVPPPDVQTPVHHQDLRSPDARDAAVGSPGHPSGQPGVPADDVVVSDSGGSGVDWTPIVLAAGIGVLAICGVGLIAARRRPGTAA